MKTRNTPVLVGRTRFFCIVRIATAATLIAAAAIMAVAGQRDPSGPGAAARKIAPWVTEHTANGQQAEFMVVLVDQANLGRAVTMRTKVEKGRYVYDSLRNKSQATQGPILQWLRERGIEHRSYYIVNAILVKGSREVAEALASSPDVARVEGNPHIRNSFPQPGPAVEQPSQPQTPELIQPGIAYTHAPDVWALGYTGQGIVIGSADTGVRWTHGALKPHYRGWDGQNADHNYNWHDSIHDSVGNPCGNDSPEPCDDLFHGTWTTGTAVGDDGAGNQIGMAPGAQWIGCRNLDQGFGSPARYIECMEWFLAPYPIGGGQGDPTKAPDITNNSWFCSTEEGCSIDTLQSAVEAQAAAGIMFVTAAGNEGSDCSTVQHPPGIYEASYSVGALIIGIDTIACFSSRGPVTADGSNRIKPDISAPGVGILSATNTSDSAYVSGSGTSAATPHIAGAMALLWSAHPELRNQIDPSRTALNNAAVHIASTQCGDAGPPNNVSGWGRIDIYAAVTGSTPTPTPTPRGGTFSWVERAPIPYRAAGIFVTSDGTSVYAGGGFDSLGTSHNELLRHDPASNSWISFAPSPDQHSASQAVYFHGRIYNIGGFDAAFQPTNTTRIYDIRTNSWTTGRPMPAALVGMATSLRNGIIYIAAGLGGMGVVNTLYAYDIASDSWTTLAPMPQALWGPGFGIIDGKLYVAGGTDFITELNTLYIYDIANNTWTTGANVPLAGYAAGSAVLRGKLYVFGGSNTLIRTQIYHPGINSWSTGPNMNTPTWRFYGTAVGNHSIVAIGGTNDCISDSEIGAVEQLVTRPSGPRRDPTPGQP